MAQYLKEEVKNQILESALIIFSQKGYKRARISDIAAAADISTGNIYLYFKNKDDLFYSLITEQFKETFLKLLIKRVDALNNLKMFSDESQEAESNRTEEDLLSFWIEKRRETIIILSKSEGSKYEDFSEVIVKELVKSAIKEAAKTHPNSTLNDDYKFILHRVFQNTLETIVAILSAVDDEESIHSLFANFWTYHIAGLNALIDS